MRDAKNGRITEEMKSLAKIENLPIDLIKRRIASGRIIIPKNLKRNDKQEIKLVGIGEGLSTKVNVNIGTSTFVVDIDMEVRKAKVAIEYGTDTIMDLSTGGPLDTIRRKLIEIAPVPFGTVPIYQAFVEVAQKRKAGIYMTEDDLFNTIEKHLKDGVDFMTIHAGILREHVLKMKKIRRIGGIVSRGGAILAAWMLYNDAENPLYKNYDYLLELFAEYDGVISLGDALRPGTILDSHDYFQLAEMNTISELVKRSWEKNVQVMVEGPGHVPLNEVAANIKLEKALCYGAPYYVLGPLVTDIAAGYDHIAAAIGAAIAAAEGADLICYLTPAEHLSLPNEEQVKEGLIAAKIAAHAGDIVKLGNRAKKKDLEMSVARAELNWMKMYSVSFDPTKAKAIHEQFGESSLGPCTMCGELCVYVLLKNFLKEE